MEEGWRETKNCRDKVIQRQYISVKFGFPWEKKAEEVDKTDGKGGRRMKYIIFR